MNRFFMAAFAVSLLIASTPVEAKTKHFPLNHIQKHYARHSPTIGATAVILDIASLPAYPVEMTRSGMRARAEPMGRRQIAPSNGYSMASDERVIGHPEGCPRSAFCGCGASVRIFGYPIRDLYLASNWFKFAHAAPGPGMVAVRNHHVFVIEQVNGDGTVVAWDANSGGHATRIHTVSLSGYSVRDPHSRSFSTRRFNGGQT